MFMVAQLCLTALAFLFFCAFLVLFEVLLSLGIFIVIQCLPRKASI